MLAPYLPQPADWFGPDEALPKLLAPFVWSVPLLRPRACARLLEGLDAAARTQGGTQDPPNSMHEHAWALDALGAGQLLDELLGQRLAPTAAPRFEPFHGASLDQRYGYLVNYGPEADQDLGFHVDDSEVTLNLCLEQQGSGAELTMMGLRCDLHRQDDPQASELHTIEHEVGTAILHAGVHRHRVEPVLRGRRRNLILWARSAACRPGGGVRLPVAHSAWCAGSV